ncbi:MAG TPA: FAD-binding oxidoreductase [Jiangellaceae bacterium]
MTTSSPADVIVIGAGVVGAACAWQLARLGLAVTVVDRGPIAGGTTGAGEGNLLVSDKLPGPELELAKLSLRHWQRIGETLPDIEYDRKGGVVVADSERALAGLTRTAAAQRDAGVRAEPLTADELAGHEPHLAPDLTGGVYYPDDAQVQPMLAAARLIAAAAELGARTRPGLEVTGLLRSGDRVTGVRTRIGDLPSGAVVNAAGTWAGEVADMAAVPLPIEPRRGFVLVTEPLPRVVRHKVYAADYVAGVETDDATLQTSPVVEGTAAGPVLIGSSRERVGYDRTISVQVLRRLAAHAIRLFPVLAGVAAIRAYRGFRPYSPDHLPVIGPDPRAPGLLHACGHEGAGIGLAAGTGRLIAQSVTDAEPDLDLRPFRPDRFG